MVYQGKSVADGIGIGRLSLYIKQEAAIQYCQEEDSDGERELFSGAKEQAWEQLSRICKKMQDTEEGAEIFEAQKMILEDPEYIETVANRISSEKITAEYAVFSVGAELEQMFENMEDDFMKARAADIRDITSRMLENLKSLRKIRRAAGGMAESLEKNPETNSEKECSVILLAEGLLPSEMIGFYQERPLAVVTRKGSPASHTAILARAMGIPMITEVDFPVTAEGKTGIVDGGSGRLIVEPEGALLAEYKEKQRQEERRAERLFTLKEKETKTLDGRVVALYANIGDEKEAEVAKEFGAEGIGLFRSEMLYLKAKTFPTEEEQFQTYKAVAEAMAGKEVIIRTLDIGADKQAGYFGLEPEENPALGCRGIRFCLKERELFKTQLRAIYRAGCYGKVSILFPMIISVEEVQQIKRVIVEVKRELEEKNMPYGDCALGIMIETPAAVMISDLLAREVDFFSVGTNDLTQYTLAVDRQNPKLDDIRNVYHEAVFRMLRMVVENGHQAGCRVGLCGELAADVNMTKFLVQLGMDELSVPPSHILEVREAVRSLDLREDNGKVCGNLNG